SGSREPAERLRGGPAPGGGPAVPAPEPAAPRGEAGAAGTDRSRRAGSAAGARPRRCATAETGRQGGSDPLSALSPPAVLRGKDGRTRTGAGPAAGVLSRWSD